MQECIFLFDELFNLKSWEEVQNAISSKHFTERNLKQPCTVFLINSKTHAIPKLILIKCRSLNEQNLTIHIINRDFDVSFECKHCYQCM